MCTFYDEMHKHFQFEGSTKKESNKTTGEKSQRASLVESSTLSSGRSDKDKSGSEKRSVSQCISRIDMHYFLVYLFLVYLSLFS